MSYFFVSSAFASPNSLWSDVAESSSETQLLQKALSDVTSLKARELTLDHEQFKQQLTTN